MRRGPADAGFTLIELVLALLLMAILSTAFIPMVRMSQQRSAQALAAAGREYGLQNQMEKLVAAFATETANGGDTVSFQSKVPGLLDAGITLGKNIFIGESGGVLVADNTSKLLHISIRDASGHRLQRMFYAD